MKHPKQNCGLLLVILAALLLNTGCSGINASKSFSPLDFLLPGILQNQPPPRPVAEPREPALAMAQANMH